jgi:hypothetical protein
LQQRKLHPVMSAEGSSAVAVHTLLQERKSSLQTRKLWLPTLQGDRLGLSDCRGAAGLGPVESTVWAWTGAAARQSRAATTKAIDFDIPFPRSRAKRAGSEASP